MAVLRKNVFVGINDGGDKSNLYVFTDDPSKTARTVKVSGVSNKDWEELATDNDYLYIGDTGNNSGSRQDLMIYRVKKTDVMDKDEVIPERIMFNYEGQTKFIPVKKHNFDCEAMVIVGDSIFLFTKNRGNLKTDLYGFPKTPGYYKVRKLASFEASGLITGAAYITDHSASELALLGYDLDNHSYNPFLILFTGFTGTHFFSGVSSRIGFAQKLQTESIVFNDLNEVYITSEGEKGKKGFMYKASVKE